MLLRKDIVSDLAGKSTAHTPNFPGLLHANIGDEMLHNILKEFGWQIK
jgi:hypothetical protein